jgi:hypothetical protein
VLVVDFEAGNRSIQAGDGRARQVRQGTRQTIGSDHPGRQRRLCGPYVPAGPDISISYAVCPHFLRHPAGLDAPDMDEEQ